MKKELLSRTFEMLPRTTLSLINGGGNKNQDSASCNAGQQCSVWEMDCGSDFSCYCRLRDGVVGVCVESR
ncbi:MAG TPA: hypothetical protein VM802_17345 [Chitinophaga sp.]|uniref:hypothetical protein n=1 Tax=Chitinophaga sp. TaxID=1869181 RepID=UPI002C5E0E41|nr:hypothetical protein [Chitinophaga sp.]HVI46647.1 hypothetical protein [Chitinophaga sp.]